MPGFWFLYLATHIDVSVGTTLDNANASQQGGWRLKPLNAFAPVLLLSVPWATAATSSQVPRIHPRLQYICAVFLILQPFAASLSEPMHWKDGANRILELLVFDYSFCLPIHSRIS